MTPTPDTPNRTPEEIVAAAFTAAREPEYKIPDPQDEEDAAIAVRALREVGLLVAAPTEEQTERYRKLLDRAYEALKLPRGRLETTKKLGGLALPLTVALEHFVTTAGVAPQESREIQHLLAARELHQTNSGLPAPSPDREKLIAEAREALQRCLFASGSDHAMLHDALDALAAVPDETELAEAVGTAVTEYMQKHSDWNCGELGYPGAMKDYIARVVREWWEKKR